MSAEPNRSQQLEARVTQLEELFTHLQRTVETLNEVLLDTQRRLDAVTSGQQRLAKNLEHLSEPAGRDGGQPSLE